MIPRFLSNAIAWLGCTAAAGAADLPAKTLPPAPPPPLALSWEGFYLGGQVGGAWATDKMDESTALVPPQTGSASLGESGIIGGAHAGYNWQFGNLVTGLEGDFEGTSLGKSSNCLIADPGVGNVIPPGTCFPSTLAYSYRTALPWQSSVRARLGYAFDNVLVYGTGGVAVADISTRYTQSLPGAAIGNGSQTFDRTAVGFTVGGGVEYSINANWSARAEYRYSDFGKVSNPISSAGLFWNGYADHHSVTENAVLFGVSYRFGAPAVGAR